MAFDYDLNFKTMNFRNRPDLYRVGIGEQGVLLVEPYKSELLPLWKFKTPDIARRSSQALENAFYEYLREGDFIGMDMARKYIQMGYTRSRRYANHRSGQKYEGAVPRHLRGQSGSHGRNVLPIDADPVKAKSAAIFKRSWDRVEACKAYRDLKREWKIWYG